TSSAARAVRWSTPGNEYCLSAVASVADRQCVPSDRHAIAVEFVVLVIATLPRTQVAEALDELDGLDPLHLFEAQLELIAQPQRRTVQLIERLTVHLVGEEGQVVPHVVDVVRIVVASALTTGPERVEDGPACPR